MSTNSVGKNPVDGFTLWFRLVGLPVIAVALSIPNYFVDPEYVARFHDNPGISRYYIEYGAWAYTYDLIPTVLQVILLSETYLLLSDFLHRFFSWEERPLTRILVQLTAHSGLSIAIGILVNGFYYLIVCNEWISPAYMLFMLAFSVLATIALTGSYTGLVFFNRWRYTVLESEKMKRSLLASELRAIKNQIDPHFLFNTLNVLSSLIEENPSKATEFVSQMAKVYRYVLQSHHKSLVTYEEELAFAKSYLYLLETRFGTNLKTIWDIDEQSLNKFLPVMSLQLLIENAVKHNIVSIEKPLTIFISATPSVAIISNTLQLKSLSQIKPINGKIDENHVGIGLKSIEERYELLSQKGQSKKGIRVSKDNEQFTVLLPLLTHDELPQTVEPIAEE
ncbi:MAG: histidine kinase [Chloroherpetonaceae bacterium]|nr:histidine kinase [Chloroherpetonaceae bacterium]